MRDSHHDDCRMYDKAPLLVTHVVSAADATREAAYRMQLAQEMSERLDVHSLAAVGTALADITRVLAQVAGALPDSVDQHHSASQEILDGLVAFRIAVLDASVAARSLGSAATSAVPHQRRG